MRGNESIRSTASPDQFSPILAENLVAIIEDVIRDSEAQDPDAEVAVASLGKFCMFVGTLLTFCEIEHGSIWGEVGRRD